MATEPVMLWPSTVSTSPVPSRRRYGPAGRSSVRVVSPSTTEVETAVVPVLTARLSAPLSEVPAGRVTAMVPLIRPATPLAPTTRRPDPPVIRAP